MSQFSEQWQRDAFQPSDEQRKESERVIRLSEAAMAKKEQEETKTDKKLDFSATYDYSPQKNYQESQIDDSVVVNSELSKRPESVEH